MSHASNCIYFRVTYLDPEMKLPIIQSFLCLGKNLSNEDAEDTWYFQDLADYQNYGSALSALTEGTPVVCLNQSSLKDDMFDLDGLCKELETAELRRQAGDYPGA